MKKEIKEVANKIIKIRVFEETIMNLFSENKLSGTTHTYIGQEATAVALMRHIEENDKVFSNHRCHGHYIAYGGSRKKLLAEIMSKSSGLCQGRGGSQHIHFKNFYSNGIQGGIVPNGLGVAWADKLNNNKNVTIIFLGDGTLGQGIVYESLNMAALFEIPVLFVVENNYYAMSTSNKSAISGNIVERARAFGISTGEIESNDVQILNKSFKKAFKYIRKTGKPFFQVVHSYRLAPHSKGDDYRDQNEINLWKKKDPIIYLKKELGSKYCNEIRDRMYKEMTNIISELETDDCIDVNLYTKLYISSIEKESRKNDKFLCDNNEKVLTATNEALDELMQENENIILLGEDICDPYGGAFKVTRGLSNKYIGRVINTPISEASITGAGVGLALNGKKPIVEIMFGDFISLCFDQILNHAVKYGWVYGESIKVPIVLRVPMGAGRGYGPTHSQSLEKHLLGIPFLSIMAVSNLFDVKKLYKYAINNCNSPLIIIENKKLYSERIHKNEKGKIGKFTITEVLNSKFPSAKLTLDTETKSDFTIITYGSMVNEAMIAAEELLLKDEIQLDIVILTQLSPVPKEDLFELINSDYVGTLEEGTISGGVGAEIIAMLSENYNYGKYFRIATNDIPIPNGVILEKQIIPDKHTIIKTIKGIYYGK